VRKEQNLFLFFRTNEQTKGEALYFEKKRRPKKRFDTYLIMYLNEVLTVKDMKEPSIFKGE